MKEILKIFTSEEISEVKQGIKELILARVEQDLIDSQTYSITGDDIYEFSIEAMTEVKAEIKAIYKERMLEMYEKQFGKLGD